MKSSEAPKKFKNHPRPCGFHPYQGSRTPKKKLEEILLRAWVPTGYRTIPSFPPLGAVGWNPIQLYSTCNLWGLTNTQLTLLSQRKLALTAINTSFALWNHRSPQKYKNHPRPLFVPSSVSFGQNFWNLSHETVLWISDSYPCQGSRTPKKKSGKNTITNLSTGTLLFHCFSLGAVGWNTCAWPRARTLTETRSACTSGSLRLSVHKLNSPISHFQRWNSWTAFLVEVFLFRGFFWRIFKTREEYLICFL